MAQVPHNTTMRFFILRPKRNKGSTDDVKRWRSGP